MANEIGERLATVVGLAHDAWSREARAARDVAARRGLSLCNDELVWLDVRDLQALQRHLLGGNETALERRRAVATLRAVTLNVCAA
jgi:hypothetical protein